MTIDETKDGVVQGELDHNATFPAITNQILHNIVLFNVSDGERIIFFDKDHEKHLAFPYHLDQFKLILQAALNVPYYFLLLAATFLPTIRNDIVVLIIREEFIDRDVVDLIVARMIPSDSHDVQRDLAINDLLRMNELFADVWSFKATSTRHKQLVQLKELMKLEKVLELEDPSQLRHWV